jgi:hypothetical protein
MPAKGHTLLSPKRREVFLSMLSAGMTVEKASKAIGVTRQIAYRWRRDDETFRIEWEQAVDVSMDKVEAGLIEAAAGGDTTAAIFLLRSRKPEVYNPNLVLRRAMLELALQKAKAEANGTPIIEGQAMSINGVRTEFIHIIYMPFNWRDRSPHVPRFDPYEDDDDTSREIVPVEQDGSGLTMELPERAMCIYHNAPYQHLPASLHCYPGGEIDPKAATDLWRRIQAHNRWLAEAYPAKVSHEPRGYADSMVNESEPDPDDDPPPTIDGNPEDRPPPFDHLGGCGRP